MTVCKQQPICCSSVMHNNAVECSSAFFPFITELKELLGFTGETQLLSNYPSLVEELSNIGLNDTLKKILYEPIGHEAKSIVARPIFMHFLNKIFKTQIAAAGDMLQFVSGDHNRPFMFSLTGRWDGIIKLQ